MKKYNEAQVIWVILILSIMWGLLTNGSKTQLVLEASANQTLSFGEYLQDTQTEYNDLYRLQKSISICEGGLNKNSLAYRNNNPGNLKAGGVSDNQGHTIYKNRTQGYLAHLSLLQRRYWGKTPLEMNKHYATDKNWHTCIEFYYY